MTASSSLITNFEHELKNKLAFKASSKISVDSLLFKTFKFFDLNNQGFVSKTDFCRAISKVGVVFDNAESIDQIFANYDNTRTGRIYYNDFVNQVLFQNQPESQTTESFQVAADKTESRVQTQQVSTVATQPTVPTLKTADEVLEFTKNRLIADSSTGYSALLNIAVKFKEGDVGKTHNINQARFLAHLPFLSKENWKLLQSFYNPTPNGEINYAQIVYSIKGQSSPIRRSLIQTAFDRLYKTINKDKQNEQFREIPIDSILSQYTDSLNITRKIFQEEIGLYCYFQGIDDGVFTDEDFEDFIGFVGFVFKQDEFFKRWIEGGFADPEHAERKSIRSAKSGRREFGNDQTEVIRKSENAPIHTQIQPESFAKKPAKEQKAEEQTSPIKKGELDHYDIGNLRKEAVKNRKVPSSLNIENVKEPSESRSSVSRANSGSQLNEIELILRRIKRTLCSRGSKGFLNFEKAFKGTDYDMDCKVDFNEFKKVVKQQRIDITDKQVGIVFDVFDQLSEGLLNYPEFVYILRGEVPTKRRQVIDRVWDKVKLNEEETSYRHLKNLFKARSHPDVTNGKKGVEDVVTEMNDTLLIVQDLNGVRTEEILKEDLIEYLQNVSATIPDDALFDITMVNVWKLESTVKIEEQYAGSKKLIREGENPYMRHNHSFMVQGGTSSQNAPFGTY